MEKKSRVPFLLFRWKHTSIRKRKNLPKKSGIYAIRSWGPLGPIVYLGRSNNIYQRWNASGEREHHRLRLALLLPFGTLSFIVLKNEEYWEPILIEQFNPPWNYTRVPARGFVFNLWWYARRTDWSGVLVITISLTVLGVALPRMLEILLSV